MFHLSSFTKHILRRDDLFIRFSTTFGVLIILFVRWTVTRVTSSWESSSSPRHNMVQAKFVLAVSFGRWILWINVEKRVFWQIEQCEEVGMDNLWVFHWNSDMKIYNDMIVNVHHQEPEKEKDMRLKEWLKKFSSSCDNLDLSVCSMAVPVILKVRDGWCDKFLGSYRLVATLSHQMLEELENGRLAMFAFSGIVTQAEAVLRALKSGQHVNQYHRRFHSFESNYSNHRRYIGYQDDIRRTISGWYQDYIIMMPGWYRVIIWLLIVVVFKCLKTRDDI